ncbi:MAG: SGNH/GDSL hydrolase family protein [Pseudomonadota bacterium]
MDHHTGSATAPRKGGLLRTVRTFLANLGLTGITVVICLFVAEVALRIVDGVQIWPPVNLIAKDQALLTTQTSNSYHPVLGWVLRPGIRGAPDDPDGSFTTGDHGVRMNSTEVVPLPEGAILTVGDSFTAGSEVGDRHSWPAQLERLLGKPVINAAAGGWAADQIVLRGEELTPIVKPRTVVVSFLADDVLRAGYRVYGSANKPWFSLDSAGSLVHNNNPVPVFSGKADETDAPFVGYFYLPTWVMDRLGRGADWRRGYDSYIKNGNDPIAVSCKLVERARDFYAARDIRLIFMLQYGGHAEFENTSQLQYGHPVVECARELGIETIDTHPPLLDVRNQGLDALKKLYVMHGDNDLFGHMSAAGNALIAELVAARLRASGAAQQ